MKDVEISPFSAIRSLLTGQDVNSLSSRLDMYFVDFGLMSLFVQVGEKRRGEKGARRGMSNGRGRKWREGDVR